MDTYNTVSLGFATGVGFLFVVAVFTFAFAKQSIEELAREIGEADVMSKILPVARTPLEFLSLLNKASNLREQCLSNMRSGKWLAAITCAKEGKQAARDARTVIDLQLAEATSQNRGQD
jgi:hypothetical protein